MVSGDRRLIDMAEGSWIQKDGVFGLSVILLLIGVGTMIILTATASPEDYLLLRMCLSAVAMALIILSSILIGRIEESYRS